MSEEVRTCNGDSGQQGSDKLRDREELDLMIMLKGIKSLVNIQRVRGRGVGE
jgi:hypothetical protein